MNKIQKLFTLGPTEIFRRLLFTKGFTFFERFGIHTLPVHFYSPVPDTRELRKRQDKWYREEDFSGIDFNIVDQKELLRSLKTYNDEFAQLPPFSEISAKGLGEGYGEVEASILYAIIRHFKSTQIKEVGSGVSSLYTLKALDKNKETDGKSGKLTCIEPYPKEALKSLTRESKVELKVSIVQDVEPGFFSDLNEGDILFIDSSHVLKLDSDVYHLYLRVLPLLKKGVIIHIHDIHFPFLTPEPERWIFKDHQFWTEAALLQAFLAFNKSYKILLCSSYLHHKYPEIMQEAFSVYDPKYHSPSSIWLRKVE